MGRPRIANPKSEYIGTKTTKDLKKRFDRVCSKKGLKGDDWLVLFLGAYEKDEDNVQSQIVVEKMRLKEINKEIKELENEKIIRENNIEELNEKAIFGNHDVENAVEIILQRFHMQSVYNILDFLNENRELVKTQAYLAGVSVDELDSLVFDRA